MAIPGELAVAVYDSHPRLGELYEYAFYLEPPYRPEQVERKRDEQARRWIKIQSQKGRELKTRILLLGPFEFEDPDRRILDSKWLGCDEYVMQAWFKRDKPVIVRASRIDYLNELRRSRGLPVGRLFDAHNDMPVRRPAPVVNDWMDR